MIDLGSRHHRRAFMLMELVGALLLVAVAMTMATGLLRSSFRLARAAKAPHPARLTTDRVLGTLRADVWNSYEIRAGDERTVVLRQPEAHSVIWRVLPDPGVLERTRLKAADVLWTDRWPLAEADLRFRRDGPYLVVVPATGGERTFFSQLALLRGQQP
ncbi:MAG: hypothetical protein OER86_12720 [Phycisphaerae bacterium]|nr:hypothetical protein [Phycisphaerae bacterium]